MSSSGSNYLKVGNRHFNSKHIRYIDLNEHFCQIDVSGSIFIFTYCTKDHVGLGNCNGYLTEDDRVNIQKFLADH